MQLIKRLGTLGTGRSQGEFKCGFCDKVVVRRLADGKHQLSCGCVKGELISNALRRHGQLPRRLFSIWNNMHTRCRNPRTERYRYYGGRGIAVCREWHDFIEFREWAFANNYQDNLEIDRIDNDGDYCPENCHWVTHKENVRKRECVKLNERKAAKIRDLYATGKITQRALAVKFGIHRKTVFDVIHNQIWV